ncbi:Kelch domain-containing protein 2, partial [Geodia barretti]
MAATLLARLTGSSTKYEPLPRIFHISGRVGSKVVVQGGRTKDFSDKSRQQLSSVVEIFDPYSELWEQRQVEGDAPSPGTCAAASASLCDDLYSFGGFDGRQHFNTLHRLDSKTWCWSQMSPQNADGAPMPKTFCAMIAFRNSLVVFGGHGVPRGPTEPQSFIQTTTFTDGEGWTNELHMYNLSEGVWSCPATTGERPPPCAGHTFTAVDDRRAVVFGGKMESRAKMNDVYIIDLSTM